ncbi:MAG: hypothetical protein IJW64_03860 [Clostridia bacterium]|nr:hypothetical protein [Clostridia bacterium]
MRKQRIFAIILAIFMVVCSFGMLACGKKKSNSRYQAVYNLPSNKKITIKVKNYGMGPGTLWLDEAADRFAEKYQDVKYGNKTGVYVKIEEDSEQNTNAMANDSTNIFFDEKTSDPNALAQSNLLLNLDSIVKDTTREGGTLESKIFSSTKNIVMKGDSYYALPHYEFYPGVVFNRDTFDKLNAYFAHEDEVNTIDHSSKYGDACFIGDETAQKSVGPDGEPDTDDDGLPCSLEEFIILCDYIKKESNSTIYPITVTGKYFSYYPDYLMMGLWASLAGAEQMRNYYNCTGAIEVVERDSSGNYKFTSEPLFEGIDYVKKPVTKVVQRKEDGSEGWMGSDMAAKYYAIAMFEILYKEGFLSPSATKSNDHWETQMDLYLDGKFNTNNSAMLIEGSYWYNESNEKGGFDYYESYVGKKRDQINVSWMGLPTKVYTEDTEAKDPCLLDCACAYAMINGNVAKNDALKQACLDFLAFLYTEQELGYFTAKTGIARPINYTLTSDNLSVMSNYAKQLWKMRDSAQGSNIVSWSGTTEMFLQKKGTLKLHLDCGVFGSGKDKVSTFIKNNKSASEILQLCSTYAKWN